MPTQVCVQTRSKAEARALKALATRLKLKMAARRGKLCISFPTQARARQVANQMAKVPGAKEFAKTVKVERVTGEPEFKHARKGHLPKAHKPTTKVSVGERLPEELKEAKQKLRKVTAKMKVTHAKVKRGRHGRSIIDAEAVMRQQIAKAEKLDAEVKRLDKLRHNLEAHKQIEQDAALARKWEAEAKKFNMEVDLLKKRDEALAKYIDAQEKAKHEETKGGPGAQVIEGVPLGLIPEAELYQLPVPLPRFEGVPQRYERKATEPPTRQNMSQEEIAEFHRRIGRVGTLRSPGKKPTPRIVPVAPPGPHHASPTPPTPGPQSPDSPGTREAKRQAAERHRQETAHQGVHPSALPRQSLAQQHQLAQLMGHPISSLSRLAGQAQQAEQARQAALRDAQNAALARLEVPRSTLSTLSPLNLGRSRGPNPKAEDEEGTGGGSAITYDSQINKALAGIPGYQGAITIDRVRDIKLSPTQDTSFVVNSDPSSKPGQHWVAVLVSPTKSKDVEVFDSLAELSPMNMKRLTEALRHLVQGLGLPYRLKYKVNQHRDQRANSNSCGYFATRFLLDRARGKDFAEASGYKNITQAENSLKPLEAEFRFL
jgi:hypothetical protein